MKIIRLLQYTSILALVILLSSPLLGIQVQLAAADSHSSLMCPFAANCAELDPNLAPQTGPAGPWYVGHDEPSLLFYDSRPGSGNSAIYYLTLPKEPPSTPNQKGTRGTYNFQLHIAPWFGMALCDSQSAPNPPSNGAGNQCTPDSDTNIFDNPSNTSANYLGHGPGVAYMEMQFYAPGWVDWPAGNSCDATKWCAALNIDSYSANLNTNTFNNPSCQAFGIEYVNFAFITTTGVPQPGSPPNPIQATLSTFTPNPAYDLLMNAGDVIQISMHDTSGGFQVTLDDLTTGQVGFMTASAKNGFGQEVFNPTASSCTLNKYDFHPMYATSGQNTRVVWAAHSYNVAFSDEIGHFEYCGTNQVKSTTDPFLGPTTTCTAKFAGDKDASASGYGDDALCLGPPFYTSTKIPISGCIGYDPITGGDPDFDGVSYTPSWPGMSTRAQDYQFHPQPWTFTSPLFFDPGNLTWNNYQQVAFENDLPRIELDVNNGPGATPCNRLTGTNCTDPATPHWNSGNPVPYPIYTTTGESNVHLPGETSCVWQFGGNYSLYHPTDPYYPTNTFGGTPGSEYGTAFNPYYYPGAPTTPQYKMDDFRNILNSNPCPSSVPPPGPTTTTVTTTR